MSYEIVKSIDLAPTKEQSPTNQVVVSQLSVKFGFDASKKAEGFPTVNLVEVRKNEKAYLAFLLNKNGQAVLRDLKANKKSIKGVFLVRKICDFYNIDLKGEFTKHVFQIEIEGNLIVLQHPKKFGE